jgi:hypothetical protein
MLFFDLIDNDRDFVVSLDTRIIRGSIKLLRGFMILVRTVGSSLSLSRDPHSLLLYSLCTLII